MEAKLSKNLTLNSKLSKNALIWDTEEEAIQKLSKEPVHAFSRNLSLNSERAKDHLRWVEGDKNKQRVNADNQRDGSRSRTSRTFESSNILNTFGVT